jgi:TATA-binding protein-associated factor Taf7
MCLQCYVKDNNHLYSNVVCDCDCIIINQKTIEWEIYCLKCLHWVIF